MDGYFSLCYSYLQLPTWCDGEDSLCCSTQAADTPSTLATTPYEDGRPAVVSRIYTPLEIPYELQMENVQLHLALGSFKSELTGHQALLSRPSDQVP